MLAIIFIITTTSTIIINPGTEIDRPLLAEDPAVLHKTGVTGVMGAWKTPDGASLPHLWTQP